DAMLPRRANVFSKLWLKEATKSMIAELFPKTEVQLVVSDQTFDSAAYRAIFRVPRSFLNLLYRQAGQLGDIGSEAMRRREPPRAASKRQMRHSIMKVVRHPFEVLDRPLGTLGRETIT